MSSQSSSPLFIVSLNSNKVLEYHRDRTLKQSQLEDLKRIDTKLDKGISIAGKFISTPNPQEKAVFIANQLVIALKDDNEPAIALTSAYLATRYSDLKHLKISTTDDRVSIELINDQEFTQQAPMKFVPKKELL